MIQRNNLILFRNISDMVYYNCNMFQLKYSFSYLVDVILEVLQDFRTLIELQISGLI